MSDVEGLSSDPGRPTPSPPSPHGFPLEEVDLRDPPPPPTPAELDDPAPYGRPSEELVIVKELEDLEETAPSPASAKKSRTRAKLEASGTVRISRKILSNAVNKLEDVGLGLVGVSEAIAGAGEGVGKVGLGGVAAAGGLMESGVGGLLVGNQLMRKHEAREVDTVTEVDISGTIVKDLNREIEIEQLKGTSNADSPLNTPWILLVFPILPLAIMYTTTLAGSIWPHIWSFICRMWIFFGWRFWFCVTLAGFLGVIVAWDTIKEIGAIRGFALQLDVHVIKLKTNLAELRRRQEPKIYKSIDNLAPPIRAALRSLDEVLTPKLGYSPLVALRARYYGWKYDTSIQSVALQADGSLPPQAQVPHGTNGVSASILDSSGNSERGGEVADATAADCGDGTIVDETGERVLQQSTVHFDAVEAAEAANEIGGRASAGELVEQFFNVELCLNHIEELHRNYSSVWIEWIHRDLVMDRSVIRSVSQSDGKWKGIGASFEDYTLTGEIRLPLRADTTIMKGGFTDEPLKLVLKGRDGLPIYSNDGARRYMRDSPRIYVIGEMELSALKIGVGADTEGITRSLLRIPLHASGQEKYRAAVLYASARFTPIDMSSYSYRQMLSPLPNGEWTLRINVFELRNLQGVDSSLNSDPFVQVTTMGSVKSTDRQRKTLSCMVNQLLFFSKVCTGLEFEDEKIVIEVMDWNRLSAAEKIGVYTVDAKRLLELPGREVFRTWFALQSPDGSNMRPAGFIKLSITVIAPGGSPPHHDDAEDTEEFTSATLLKNTILKAPTMSYRNWAIHITVGWADMLPRMASPRYRDAVRGYMTFDYSGYDQVMTQTNISVAKGVVDPNIGDACLVMPQRRVIWNEEYVLPLTIINDRVSQEGIHLGLFHRVMPRLQAPFRENQLIGNVNVSFFELFKNMCTAVVRGQPADGEDSGDRVHKVAMMKPRYYNFYGMPDGPADPYDKGVAFRGRVLIGVAAKPGHVAKPYIRPCPPPPRPKLDFYKIDFTILRATELSLPNGWSVYVECRIGLYSFGHTVPKVFVQNQCVQWDENCNISIPNLQFPEDVEQIPDLFVTLFARKPSTVAVLEEEEHGKKKKRKDGKEGKVEVASEDDEEGTAMGMGESGKISLDGVGGGVSVTRDENGATTTAGIIPDATPAEGDGSTWQPKAFVRLPAKNLITGQTEARWIFMDYPGNNVLDTNDTKVPGSLLVAAALSRFDPTDESIADDDLQARSSATPSRGLELSLSSPVDNAPASSDEVGEIPPAIGSSAPVSSQAAHVPVPGNNDVAGLRCYKSKTYSTPVGAEQLFTLRALILQGRNLPAADESGLSDPRVVVSIGNKSTPGKVFCRQTVSPLWQEIVEVRDIAIREGERKPNVNVIIYDYDSEEEPMQYLGRAIVPSAEMDTADPTLKYAEWYPVFSVNPGIMVGEILADFQLIPNDLALALPAPTLAPPMKSQSALRISLLGLRDVKFLKYASGDIFVECSVSGGSTQPFRSKRGAMLQQRAYEANCNILDVLVLDILVPDDLRLAPALTVYVYAEYSHSKKEELIATACIPLENWLSEHERKLLTGESLLDDSYGMDAPISLELASKGYMFRRNASFVESHEDCETLDSSIRLHKVIAKTRSEQRQILALQECDEVLRIGYPERKRDAVKAKAKEKKAAASNAGSSVLASIRAVKNSVADSLADVMPDVTQALGIEVEEDVPIAALATPGSDTIDYDGTRLLKKDRGLCPHELEIDFSEPTYGEFLLFRGDNRGLGNTTGRMANSEPAPQSGTALPPILPWNEAPSEATLKKREQRRANMEGARPAVGKVKARLDLVELESHDEIDIGKVRLTSLRSFGRVFVPKEVVVRVYVLRGINLQQGGSECNPYLTCKFYGGFPDFYSQKHDHVKDNDNPNFFHMFESRVKMPGGSIRIEVKDRVLPEVSVPLTYPTWISDDGTNRFGLVSKEVPVNVGNLGLGWSEHIGETLIDLDARWYNSSWRSLKKAPVETRTLTTEESSNIKGQLELFVEIFDAKEVDKHPKLYRPLPISKPPQQVYVMRVVVYKVIDCTLPYIRAGYNPAKLAALYVVARLGNRPDDERATDRCKYVTDGTAQFNWRMKWDIKLPSVEIKPRLKITVFEDTSMGLGNGDDLCAVTDIKLRSLMDEIVLTRKPIVKKKQYIELTHPNFPEVLTRVQLSMELTTKQAAAKKKCFTGKDGYKDTQHVDYVLPTPYRPAAFSLLNPGPYISYLIFSTVNSLQWTLATVLLLFAFVPMSVQFIFMKTPWQWYFTSGCVGAVVFVRLFMVQSAKAARTATDSRVVVEEDVG